MQEELVGPEERQQLLEAELVGKRWAAFGVLDPQPCCQSGDAWYFRVGFTFEHSQLQFAAKVPKPCCSSLGMQSFLGTHCSIQRLLGHFTDRLPRELVLPGIPGTQSQGPSREESACPAPQPVLQVFLCAEVPQQTLADFVKGSHALHRTSPGHYERLGCLLLLQLCMGLEHLRGQNMAQGDLCPENLLLVQCPCPPQRQKELLGLSLPRLLISSFFKVQEKQRPRSSSQEQDWSQALAAPSPPAAAELNLGRLIYQILHVDISLENILGFRSKRLPEIPSLSIYSAGLKRLASLLLHRDPVQRVSIEQARAILQVLLWGPRQELFARSRKSLELLQRWLQVKRALLLLRFAENSVGARVSPGLEEWLCCQYFQGITEHTLYQVTQVLYAP
ncbi:inactive tyrosine-protein kinase PRAG1-like [Onychostruthus taczanowskii]|uniref:inactive tyrosine-protein kinase PRAG1-like n=1 Tax=Onychostruthus taczanowskii TaxID=356909 RepID=UPI001B807C50|nr:inactive tyrosine-protein kinase PRAG1-like [Onychostruthus taczanowskii]